MAIHSINDFKHLTGQTEGGRRRSPFQTLSYNADQALHDEQRDEPEKPYHLKHPKNDNTRVMLTEIYSSEPDCKYADVTVSSALRRERMWNELTRLNDKQSYRIMAYSEIALPNVFTEHMIHEFSKEFCESLSSHFHRPVDWSVHLKTKKGQPNLHGHICFPEREYINGKWSALSVSYYLDMYGKPIINKKYKNANGNDIRKPKIRKDAPKGHEYDTEIELKTGERVYKYQVKDSNGRKKWLMKKSDWLNPDEISWIHNEYDRVCNKILLENGIHDTVKRYNSKTKEAANKAGLKIIHSNVQDAKGNTVQYKINEKNNKLARQFMENHENILTIQQRIASIDENIISLSKQLDAADSQKMKLEEKLTDAVSKADTAKKVLKAWEKNIFWRQVVKHYDPIIRLRNACLEKVEVLLINGITIINADIKKLEEQEYLLPSQQAKLKLWKANKQQIELLIAGIQNEKKKKYVSALNQAFIKKWQSLCWEKRAGLVYAVFGEKALSQYKMYYHLEKNQKINPFIPSDINLETSVQAAIEDIATPSIMRNYKNELSSEKNVLMMFEKQFSIWKKDLESEYHTPPRELDVLKVLCTAPSKYIQISNNNRNTDTVITPIPNDFNPLLPHKEYENSWSVAENEKYDFNVNKRIEELRQACTDQATELRFSKESALYEKYLFYKKPSDRAYKDYLNVKQEEEEEAKKRTSFFFVGSVNQTKIDRYRRYYECELAELNEKFPDGFPAEPNKRDIRQEILQDMKDKSLEELLTIAKTVKVPVKHINNYIEAKVILDDYTSWKDKINKNIYGTMPLTIKWNEQDYHELNEMEKAERNMVKGWKL